MRIESNQFSSLDQVKNTALDQETKHEETKVENKPAAVYEKTKAEDKTHTYNAKAIAKLKQQTENNKLKVIELIQRSVNKQTGLTDLLNLNKIGPNNLKDLRLEDINFEALKNLSNIDESVRQEAESLISEDGEFGVNKTSDRIFDFAVAISGGDTSKYSVLKDAIEKGFKEAEKAFGGELPQISQDTLTRVMEKLDTWANKDIKTESEE